MTSAKYLPILYLEERQTPGGEDAEKASGITPPQIHPLKLDAS